MPYRFFCLALLWGNSCFAAVSVTIKSPQPAENVAQIYQTAGTASTTTGSITRADLFVDGVHDSTLSGTTNWLGALYAKLYSAGLHVVIVQATDSMGNTGSASVTVTFVHSNPECSHTLVGGSIHCERAANSAASNSNTVAVTFPAGYTAGQLIVVSGFFETGQAAQVQTGSASNAQTTITVGAIQPASPFWPFPSTPFDACWDNERITVTNISGSTWTIVRGVSGLCMDTSIPGTGLMKASTGAASHADGSIIQRWGFHLTQPKDISNTNGYSWHHVASVTSGAFGDFDVVDLAFWWTIVPATTSTSDTITITPTYTDGNFQALEAVVYSGAGSIRPAFSTHINWAGPVSGGDCSSGAYRVAPGDLVIGVCTGAPSFPGAGWHERAEDVSRPYSMLVDHYALGTSVNVDILSNADGAMTVGVAFSPAAGEWTPSSIFRGPPVRVRGR